MSKSIKVNIGGKEYSLRGENETLINQLADEVNEQIELIGSRHSGENATTISVLAALNLAEKAYREKVQNKIDEKYIVEEVNKLKSFIEEKLQALSV